VTTTGDKRSVNPPTRDQTLADDLRSIEKRRPFRWGLLVGALAAVAAALLPLPTEVTGDIYSYVRPAMQEDATTRVAAVVFGP